MSVPYESIARWSNLAEIPLDDLTYHIVRGTCRIVEFTLILVCRLRCVVTASSGSSTAENLQNDLGKARYWKLISSSSQQTRFDQKSKINVYGKTTSVKRQHKDFRAFMNATLPASIIHATIYCLVMFRLQVTCYQHWYGALNACVSSQ